MLSQRENELRNRIDEVVYLGYTRIAWWELRAWYGLERISKNVWRDLQDRFRQAEEDNTKELWIYDEAEDGIVLLHPVGLKTITQKISEKSG
jgi:DNA-directed RNA polymerase delta subunit